MGELVILPCLDSPEIALERRRELDIDRQVAAELGITAVIAARKGYYLSAEGEAIDWHESVQAACAGRQSIRPDAVLPTPQPRSFPETRVQVTNETTLGAARRLTTEGKKPLALNFANGVHPGGGFQSGARAQEEVLCRSSALYATLQDDLMYAAHRQRPRPDSTAWAIMSPNVPVFRNDDGTTLDSPWLLNFITCAAPFAPALSIQEAAELLEHRTRRVLAIARAYNYTALVLGAWGCGAFRNDPQTTALAFRQALEGDFDGAFSDVVFAVTDWSPERRYLGPFRDVFSQAPGQDEEARWIVPSETLAMRHGGEQRSENQTSEGRVSRMKQYCYELINGHIIVTDGSLRLLVDTGAPTSVAETTTFSFGGKSFPAVADYMGVTPASLSAHIGSEVSALVGADVLNQYDVLIDSTDRTVRLDDGTQDLNGEILPLDFFMGIPIVEAGVGTRTIRMFFDTGAKLSYLSPDLTGDSSRAGREGDFYPGIGEFTTEVFDVDVQLGDESCKLRVGHLPELLQMTLMMADTSGILGTAILSHYAIHYAPRRSSLVLRRSVGAVAPSEEQEADANR